ncbi:hypothetical protein [Pimelobacter simplex]|uniref:hypothetical protein n=1 Tax=Nocardioides simplex TaxID=2045 RepID=UPI00214F816B|nr:hypothetical protein [Pimelobacter simplex]UUW88481.1 hypothetical protein M0M43_22440 [Pimelobacter simplex]UUW97985.1 hypothetical protein M0M48_11085 [Pimelobacter simplex]
MTDVLFPRAVPAGSLTGRPGKDGPPGPNTVPTIDAVTEYVTEDTPARDAVDARVVDGMPVFTPEAYNASANPAVDNRAALQAAIDAAAAAGGGVVQLNKGRRYGWTGQLIVRNGVTLVGNAVRQPLAPDQLPSVPGLVALSAAAQVLVGGAGAGTGTPAGLRDVYIDGNYLGGNPAAVPVAGLVRISGVDVRIDNVYVTRSAGDGIVYNGLQNSTVVGGISTLHIGCALVLDNGSGAVAFHSGYYGTSKGGSLRCRDTAGEANPYPFGPTHNTFIGTIFEAYPNVTATWPTAPLPEPFARHVHVSGRSIEFVNCNFTGGADNAEAATVLIDDTVSYIPATVSFVSCLWWTRGGHDAVRVKGTASASFIGQQEVGDDGTHHPTSFVCIDTGFPHINMVGEVILPGDTNGDKIYRAINSGSLIGVFSYHDAGMVHRLRDVQSVGWRREGDAVNRFQVERDGILRWFNGVDGTTRATLQRAVAGDGKGIVVGGRFYVADGLNVIADGYTITTTGQSVTLDASTGAEHQLVFTANGNSIGTLAITNAVNGDRLRIMLFGVGTNSITWPANVEFAGLGTPGPQPVNAKAVTVDLEYVAGTVNKWIEVSRSSSGPAVRLATTATGAATAGKTATLTGYTPTTGDLLALTLTNGNTAVTSPTLGLNGGAANPIWLAGLAASPRSVQASAGGIWMLQWDGTRWNMLGAAANVADVTQLEAESGTAIQPRWWTPQRVAQAVRAIGDQWATATDLASATSAVNTQNKRAGRFCYDVDNRMPLWASGSSATHEWVDATGNTTIVPT